MRRILAFISALLLTLMLPAQDQSGLGPKEKSVKSEMRLRKQIRKEDREKRAQERAERKAVKKHHKRIQTKAVRKRMKKSRATAARNHDNRREFFLKRWFKKKHNGRLKPVKKD